MAINLTRSITFLLLVGAAAASWAQISGQPTTNLPSNMPTETSRPVSISGQVVLENGTPVSEAVRVQRVCNNVIRGEVLTDSKGKFTILLDDKSNLAFQSASEGFGSSGLGASMGRRTSQTTRTQLWGCDIRAMLPGYHASSVALAGQDFSTPVSIAPIVLRRAGEGAGNSISVVALQAPPDARKEYDKGRDQFAKGKFEKADEHLQKAIEMYPQYASALDMRGRSQRAQKQDDEAEKSFRAALAADENYVPPYLHLAALQATRGNWTEVITLSDKAVALDPLNYADPYYFKAVAHLMLKQVPEAKSSVLRVVEMDKEHRFPRAQLMLGNILRSEGDYTGASEHLRNYLALEPNTPESANVRAFLAEVQKQNVAPNP
jgi:tetratricopeptide (TPR) repeat protein